MSVKVESELAAQDVAANLQPITAQLMNSSWPDVLQRYQTFLVGMFVFTISLATFVNAATATYLNQRNRTSDENRKRIAFFAILERDLSNTREQLRTAKDILDTIDIENNRFTQWLFSVRVASRISPLRSLDHDWEKLYVIGANNIRNLRRLTLALQDIEYSFKELLPDSDGIRTYALPLFESLGKDDEKERAVLNIEGLVDQIDSALEYADCLLDMLAGKLELGAPDAVQTQKE